MRLRVVVGEAVVRRLVLVEVGEEGEDRPCRLAVVVAAVEEVVNRLQLGEVEEAVVGHQLVHELELVVDRLV